MRVDEETCYLRRTRMEENMDLCREEDREGSSSTTTVKGESQVRTRM
jgi:hypothetical protein